MKELARKGNIRILPLGSNYVIKDNEDSFFATNSEELPDIIKCCQQITAKKWIVTQDDGFRAECPDCNYGGSVSMNFCPMCGLELEGVEE